MLLNPRKNVLLFILFSLQLVILVSLIAQLIFRLPGILGVVGEKSTLVFTTSWGSANWAKWNALYMNRISLTWIEFFSSLQCKWLRNAMSWVYLSLILKKRFCPWPLLFTANTNSLIPVSVWLGVIHEDLILECQGVNNPSKYRWIGGVINSVMPDWVDLQKTKLREVSA